VRPQLFTIKYLGGWAKVDRQFFNARTGIVTRIQQQAGG
jgi:ABC-type sulfate transport system substrate-binding protein